MTHKPRVSSVAVLSLMLTVPALFADGYRNTPEGARAVGAFGGHRAFADDANATIHNSANLVDLEKPMVQLNLSVGYGRNKFDSAFASSQTENPIFIIPGYSVAFPLQDGKFAVGFATYVPYGRAVDWGQDSVFAQNNMSYSGSMRVFDFTPNVAMRLTDSISVGAGADIYYGQVEQKTLFTGPVAMLLGLPQGTESKLTADGAALGWNCAITWKLTDRQRLAATYRAPFSINYEGDNDLTTGARSDVSAEIEYPAIAALAYGVEFSDTLRAEINGEWLDFSQYETLKINDSDPRFATTVPQRLKETWTAGVGMEWDFAPQWALRSGFMYLENPTPQQTYGPLGPDESQYVVSLGLGYETGNHAIDLGYAAGIFDGRNISGSVNSPDGRYNYNVHLLTLSYGYSF